MNLKITIRNGFVQDISPPEGVRVAVYDYDTKKYSPTRLELDPGGAEMCVGKIYFKYPYDVSGKQVKEIRYDIVLAVMRNKVRIIECPDEVKIDVIEEK